MKSEIFKLSLLIIMPILILTGCPSSHMSGNAQNVRTFSVGNFPFKIAADSFGNAWVLNFKDNTVTRLSRSQGVIGTYPVDPSSSDFATDAQGNVWVASVWNNPIVELNSSGQKIGDYSAGFGPVKNSSYPLVVIALEPGVLYGDKV